MKKFIPVLIIGILVLSGLGAYAIKIDNLKSIAQTDIIQEPIANLKPLDYTHTVLIEVGTATWCPSCPASNLAWHSIYGGGQYDFEYTEMVIDKNTKASQRMNLYNIYWVPTSYFDGGQFVYPGTNYATFYNYLNSAGVRSVPDLVATLNVEWLGSANIEISYSVLNNDASNYPGRLRIYVLELESTYWNDYNGNPYYHAFLDFPVDQTINIPAGITISNTLTWNGATAGYPSVSQDNLQVILAVFDDTAHPGYSDPPSGAPFNAYYSDECVAAYPTAPNNPPDKPTINGPAMGKPNVTHDYTFNSVDPDGDNIAEFIINWGDGTDDQTLTGPFASGADALANHTWTNTGNFIITAKSKDIYNLESDWSEPFNVKISNTPSAPTIEGPIKGSPFISYQFTFSSIDPDGDDVSYYIDWGNGKTTDWTTYQPSNSSNYSENHSWLGFSKYIIKAKAKDSNGLESPWSELSFSTPRNKALFNKPLVLLWLVKQFPILKHLMGY